MKTKLLSFITVLSLVLNPLYVLGAEISFDELDSVIQEDNSSLEAIDYSVLNEDFDTSNNDPSYINMLAGNGEDFVSGIYIPENLSYTTVDITDVFTGSIISHDCNMYLISNFDETEHWNECTVCGKILNKETHNYIDNGWTMGSPDNCATVNVHVYICQCGSSYSNSDGRKAHVYTPLTNNPVAYRQYAVCQNCSSDVSISDHECIKSDGSKISCDNPGKCSICDYNYPEYHCGRVYVENKTLSGTGISAYCTLCSKYMGTTSFQIKSTSDGYVTINNNISINGNYSSLTSTYHNYESNLSIISHTQSNLSQTVNLKYNAYTENCQDILLMFDYVQNGANMRIATYFYPNPEYTPPVITDIISNSQDWSTDSTIFISGTENYCNTVKLTLKDTEGNVYLENISIPVTNKNWSYEIKPSLESQENTEFILQVTDTLGNTIEQSFYISKVDTIPPNAVDSLSLNTLWSKTKDYVFTSSDYGIGQVQNSVISTDNYELATENENIFYKGYTFTGDVYGETLVPVYMKDGLGNQNVEFVSVSNLDNTLPTIENIEYNKTLHNTEITILANDINEKLNASGSGVTGYAISTKNEIPQTFQESNTFNLTEAGTYYLFITDLVGNVTSKEIYIPVQYKVIINPDGGTWKGETTPQEIETDEPINLYPEPEKEGHTFKEWSVEGEGEITPDGELIVEGDVQVAPIWEANTYSVTYIDYNVTSKEELKRIIKELNYNTTARGFDLGSDTTDNAYYNQYRLVSDTSITVSTNPENNVVYRYFEFCYTSKESHINFNDNDNADGLRPETYKLQLILEDGKIIQEVELPTTQPDYVFENLPKYDEQGEEYIYKIIPIISDRYTPIEPNEDEDGNINIIYSNPDCKILIPKTTTLDGKNGNLNYTIQIDTNLFYQDKIIIIPEENVTLTDGIKNITATITQDKTEFTKDDELKITGQIQTTKKHFAGTWTGTFNFKIKYEVSN